jgi:hypothetical protein
MGICKQIPIIITSRTLTQIQEIYKFIIAYLLMDLADLFLILRS